MTSPVDLKDVAAVAGAIATVVSGLITGLVSIYLKKRADQAIEKLKADLSHENKVRGARVDYEYEARKRLYREVEPILFAAHLSATSMRGRVSGLVDRLRDGYINLDKKKTWMADRYYQTSTAYRLFLPIAHTRLLSQKISQLDLTLEPLIGRKFMVLGIFEDIFVAHFDLTKVKDAAIPYEPYAEVPDQVRNENPGRYNFQGLVRGEVEQLLSAMLSATSPSQIPIEWFKFEQQLEDKASDLSKAYGPIRNLLIGFHPTTHPVVWRELISCLLLSNFYVEARDFTIEEYDACCAKYAWELFDFRTKTERNAESQESQMLVSSHFEAARTYVRGEIESGYRTLAAAASAVDM